MYDQCEQPQVNEVGPQDDLDRQWDGMKYPQENMAMTRRRPGAEYEVFSIHLIKATTLAMLLELGKACHQKNPCGVSESEKHYFIPEEQLEELRVAYTQLKQEVHTVNQSLNQHLPEMTTVVGEMEKVAVQVTESSTRERQEDIGTAVGLTAIASGIIAAPFTEGMTLAITVGGVVTLAAAKSKGGMKGIAKKVRKLGIMLMRILATLKPGLKNMKEKCEGAKEWIQPLDSLLKMTGFPEEVVQLSGIIADALSVCVGVVEKFGVMVGLAEKVTGNTGTPGERKMFKESVIQSLSQSQKVIDEFEKVERYLKDFHNKIPEDPLDLRIICRFRANAKVIRVEFM